MDNVTTIFYLLIEGVREGPDVLSAVRSKLCMRSTTLFMKTLTNVVELNPSLVEYFVTVTAKLRWDEANELPQTRVS